MVRISVLIAGFTLCLLANAAEPATEPITKPGEATLFDGKLKVQVKEDGVTTQFDVAYTGTDGGSHGVGKKVESAKAAGWFIFPESATRAWMYQGSDQLTLIEFADILHPGARGTTASTASLEPGKEKTTAALNNAPKAVLDRLPASFKPTSKGK